MLNFSSVCGFCNGSVGAVSNFANFKKSVSDGTEKAGRGIKYTDFGGIHVRVMLRNTGSLSVDERKYS